MRQEPVWVSELPRTQCVGAESGVDHGEDGLNPVIVQVVVEGPDLLGHDQALVDDGPPGKGADVELA